MHTQQQPTDSPADWLDRSRFLVGAHPKDSDADLSEEMGDDDGFAGQVRKDQNSLKGQQEEDTGDDLDEADREALGDLDEDADGTDDRQADDERDADLDEEEVTYRKRYADTKADRDEKVRQLRDTMAENARLKAIATASSDINEEELARQVQEGIFKEVSQIQESDPAKARKAAYDVVGKYIAQHTKKAVDLALSKITAQRQQEEQQTTHQAQQVEAASKRAKIALKEIGLDPQKYFKDFEREVNRQMDSDPEWFQAIPPSEHFIRIANRVKSKIERIRSANSEHQREAGGQVNSGSRVRTKPRAQDQDEDDGKLDTLRGAMSLASKANLLRGRKAFQLANLQR